MKQRRSLDLDGLDGILRLPESQSTSGWLKGVWIFSIIIILMFNLFLLDKGFEKRQSTAAPVAQNLEEIAMGPAGNRVSAINVEDTKTPSAGNNIHSTEENLQATSDSGALSMQSEANKNNHGNTKIPVPPIVTESISRPSTAASGPVDVIYTVLFKLDSSQPDRLSKRDKRQLMAQVNRCQHQIVVTGNTCNLGSDTDNQMLGLARALAVKKRLVSYGIDAQRIVPASEGMRNPASSNQTKAGHALNRRVDLHCLDN